MKLLATLLVTAALFTTPLVTHAAGTGIVDVKSVSVGISGDLFVETTGGHTNPGGCTNTTKYIINSDIGGAKSMLAILLTARASALPVALAIHNTSCQTIGAQTYATIFNVSLK